MKIKNFKRKRLNNKGFTLIELLAVVVILAIVMGIAATSVLNSINNSRKSSLYSVAQNSANTLNTWITEDMMVTNNDDKKLGDTFISATQTGDWICLNAVSDINNGGNSAKLIDALGISADDIVIDGTGLSVPTGAALTESTEPTTCSALKYNKSTGGYEFLLIAKNGGKYYVSSDKIHFAYSRATEPNVGISG